MKDKLLIIVFIVLMLIIGYQAYRINSLHKEYAEMQLQDAVQTYYKSQSVIDSAILSKLDSLKNMNFKVKNYYYKTREIVKQDEKKLQDSSDDYISRQLMYWIDKRKRASELNEKVSHQ